MASTPNGRISEPTEESPLLGDRHENDEIVNGSSGDAENGEALAEPEEKTAAQLFVMMGSLWLGSFLAAMDGTVVATLSAPISSSFNSLSLLSWLASSYFISNAAFQPLAGRLTDIFGRTSGLYFSNFFFGLGNLICGLAQDEWVMILGRVTAGIGGGGLTALSTIVASDMVPLRKRGMWQGLGNICYGVGMGAGGVLGGWMNDTIGWRWAFYIQVPLTVVSGGLVYYGVQIPAKESDKSRLKRVDYLGAITLVSALVLMLVGLNSGGNSVPWNHPLIYTSLILSGIFLAAYIYIEDRVAPEPIIPVRLLLNRTVACACLTNWFGTMSVFASMYYIPIFLQVQGLSTTQAGERLIAQAIGSATGSMGSGLIMRAAGRYYLLNVFIMSIFVVSAALVTSLQLSSPDWQAPLYLGLTGFGYGGMLTVTLVALISAVHQDDSAVITSASYAFRSTGSTIGITIGSAIFQNTLRSALWSRFGSEPDASERIGKIRDDFGAIGSLPESWKAGVKDAYMEALRGVFGACLGLAVVAGLVSLGIKQHKLHSTLARR